MSETTINTTALDDKDRLKLRMLQAKSGLPKSGYVALYEHYYPNDKYSASYLSQIWSCKYTNLEITKKFEDIANRLKTS